MSITTADIVAALRNVENRERERQVEAGAKTLADLFEAERVRQISTFGQNRENERDNLRSQQDSLRATDLEMKRLLGEITDAEEAERAALAVRRTDSGYYRPVESVSGDSL